MLYGLESGLPRRFERHRAYEMFQELKLVFQTHAHVKRYEIFDKYFAYKMEENGQPVGMYSECLDSTIAWIKWELIFQIK